MRIEYIACLLCVCAAVAFFAPGIVALKEGLSEPDGLRFFADMFDDDKKDDDDDDDENTNRISEKRAKEKGNVDLVVARYNENIDYLADLPFSKYNIICYNKGKQLKDCPNCATVEKLPNVGKCDHTYLYHIVSNYDQLADVTIFLPASCMLNDTKANKTAMVFHYVDKTNTSVFVGLPVEDLARDMYQFTIDRHMTASADNRLLNADQTQKPCQIRPFGKWHESLFGSLRTTLVDYNSIFAVAREHIQQHSREYYRNLLSFVNDDKNPECGHYIERAWISIFSPLPPSCLYNSYH